MQQLLEWLRQLFAGSLPWVVVPPWSVGVRVRLGKHATPLPPGPHLRVPVLDHIVLVNTRIRLVQGGPVMVPSEKVGWVHARTSQCFYKVTDPVLAMLSFSNPERIIQGYLVEATAKYQNPEDATSHVAHSVVACGIEIEEVVYVEAAEIQALELIYSGVKANFEEPPTHNSHKMF